MLIDEEMNNLKHQYYRIFCKIFQDSRSKNWMGIIRIKRKDTDEIVRGGFTVVDKEKTLVEERLRSMINAKLEKDLEALGVPYEWNTSIRPILVRYLKLRRRYTKFWMCFDDVISGKESSNEFRGKNITLWNILVQESIALTKSIEALTKKERVDILTLPDSVFIDPSDPWSLDEQDARIGIIQFFLSPSEIEINTHQAQLSILTDTFHKLGWDKIPEL